MPQYTRRNVSIKTLCHVSQIILTYIDKHGTCTASNVRIAEDARLGIVTVKAAVRDLLDLGAFVGVETYHPVTRTVRALSLVPWPEGNGWYIIGKFAFKSLSHREAIETSRMALSVQQVRKWSGAVALIGSTWRDISHLDGDVMEGWA